MTAAAGALLISAAIIFTGCATSKSTDACKISDELQKRFSIPPELNIEDGVSEAEAVAIALWNNAAFNETLAQLGFSRADLIQAGLLTNPSFSVLFPLGPKQLEFTATFPLEALWLRPRRVAVGRLEFERAAQTLVQHGLNLIRDVRVACADLWLANERVRLSKAALEVRQRIGELSEARLRAGDISELEVATARVDALRAQDDSMLAVREAAIGYHRLRNLLGTAQDLRFSAYGLDDDPGQVPYAGVDVLEEEAFVARPDLRAAELGIEAAGKRVGLAQAEIFAVSGLLDANDKKNGGLDVGPGAQLPIPIFNRNQAGIARAKAELERASQHYQAVKQRIRLEVHEAHQRFAQAVDAFEQWNRTIIPPLEATAQQSQRAFELGNVSFLFVQENARELLNARARYAEIDAERRKARAELERSVGHRLVSRL